MSATVNDATGLWSERRRALTTGLVLTMSLTAFEVLAIATIMPIVVRDLGSLELYGWAFSAYFLGSLLGTVVVGGFVDRRGLTGSFLGALVLFGLGLLLAGAAGSMPVLVAGRFVQGLGGGALIPVANVAIGRGYPEALRARMFATLSTAWVVPAMVGPALAGVIAELVDWRLVFLGLVPLIVIAGALTVGALGRVGPGDLGPAAADEGGEVTADGATPASPATPLDQVPTQPSRRSQPGRLGPAIAVTLGAALVTAGFSNGGPIAIGEAALPAEAATGALVSTGLLLVWAAFRRLTPPGTLRLARGLPTAIVLRGLLTFGFYPLDAYASLALIDWRGLPAGVAGLALAAGSLAWTVGSWTQARRAQRHDNATFIRVGFGLVTAGTLVFLVALDRAVPVAVAFAAFGIAGLGMGLAIPPQALIVLREASAEEQGVATSALALSDLLGTALGTGLAGAILAAGLRGGAATGAALAPAFVVAALSTALGVALSGRLRRPAAGAG